MAKDYDKEMILADWKTGGYNIRDLAYKHKVGRTTVGNIVKGVDKSLSACVDKKIKADQMVKDLSDKNGQAVQFVVDRENARIDKAKKIEGYLDTGIDIATKKGIEIMQSEDATMQDIMYYGKFQNDARVGLDLQPKFSNTPSVINSNTNAQQTIVPKTMEELFG